MGGLNTVHADQDEGLIQFSAILGMKLSQTVYKKKHGQYNNIFSRERVTPCSKLGSVRI